MWGSRGGVPLLQQRRLLPLLQQVVERGVRIEVETAATVAPLAEVVAAVAQFNVSPKLSNSGNPLQRRHRPAVLDALQATGKAAWKFVAVGPEDLVEIDDVVARHRLAPVYVMPEGTTAEVVTERMRLL